MSTRPLALAAALLCLAASAASAQDDHPILEQVRKIQQDVEGMRKLKFQAPVKVGVQKPEDLKKMLLESFDEESSADEMLKQEKVCKALGLIPRDYDLRGSILKFMSEQIGGFYDPEKKELFLIDRSAEMGAMGAAAQDMNDKMVMAHELNHALQDQNFALDRWFDLLGDHEDRVQAYKSVVEGDAQVIGMSYMFGKMGRGSVDMRALNRMQDMMMQMSPEGEKFRNVPPYLIENMMFPYTQGAEFMQDLQRKTGWEGVGRAFNDPPTSTEQVLHIEKYLAAERDEPLEIILPESGLVKILGKKTKELWANTLGEFSLSLVLRGLDVPKGKAAKAAAGWDGDRFAGYETEDGRVVVVWLTLWDSEREAAEFEQVYGAALAQARPEATLERRGNQVLMVHGANDVERPKLVRKAFMAMTEEAKLSPLPGVLDKPLASDFVPEGSAPLASSDAAPVAASAGGLQRVDELGVSLVLPEGFASSTDPIKSIEQYPSAHFGGPDGAHLRVLSLPIPLDAAVEQLEGLLKQGMPDLELVDRRDVTIGGARGLALSFVATLPGDNGPSLTRVRAIGAGAVTVVLALSALDPNGPRQGQLEAVLEDVLGTLWVDGSQPAALSKVAQGGVELSIGNVLPQVTSQAGNGAIVHQQSDAAGARISVVSAPLEQDLAAFGARLETQIPLLQEGAKVLGAGIVQRRGQPAHEIEFEAAGRRTRQVTFVQGGRRYSAAVSAPTAAFDGYRARFAQALAGFRVAAQQGSSGSSRAPEQKEEKKLYSR